MAPVNKAAWIPAARAHPMEVSPAEYPTVSDGEIIVKAAAIAINPADWLIQTMGDALFSFLKYPFCSGCDVAGTIVEVGNGVTNFKPGDRVFGIAMGFDAREGTFQEYVVLKANATARIPDNLEFKQASVLPLGICTAAAALYHKEMLALAYPTLDPKPKGETLLIWAGASSVGTNAIQLAVASGYEVFTTASPKNFDYCKMLGASQVFDYHSANIATELIEAFEGKKCAGAFAIHRGSELVCFEVVAKVTGTKFVASAVPLGPHNKPPEGVSATFVQASKAAGLTEVREMLWTKFLPAALEENKFKCLPEPLVVGQGLEKVQEALDMGKMRTVSARKLVVTL